MATLAGFVIAEGSLVWPAVGIAVAELLLLDPAVVTGKTTLVIADLSISVSVMPGRGGAVEGSARYMVCAGACGWNTKIPARPTYQNDLGVKLSTVLKHDADACKETIEIDPALDRVVGLRYARTAGRAWDTLGLDRFALPWWIDLSGKTQVRARKPVDVGVPFRTIRWRKDKMVRELASEAIAPFAPGNTIGGVVIRETSIEISHAKNRLYVRA